MQRQRHNYNNQSLVNTDTYAKTPKPMLTSVAVPSGVLDPSVYMLRE